MERCWIKEKAREEEVGVTPLLWMTCGVRVCILIGPSMVMMVRNNSNKCDVVGMVVGVSEQRWQRRNKSSSGGVLWMLSL